MGLYKTKTTSTPRRPLTFPEKLELMIGPGIRPVFPSDEARRQAWEDHREDILRAVNKTTRPWAWWEYECAEDREDDEIAQLKRLGEYTEEELALLAKWAAEARAKSGAA